MKKFELLKKREINYKKVCGLDIETTNNNKEFLLACFYAEDFQATCYTIEEVIELLQTRKMRDYVIFATNLPFDFLGLFYDYSEHWNISERNGTVYSFTWYQSVKDGYYKSNPIKFYDTINILPRSVEELGKILKIPKMDHPDFFPNRPKNKREWVELERYCLNDSIITQAFISEILYPFLKKYNVRLSSTIGSIALQIFRRQHLKKQFFQETEEQRSYAFLGYYGGRTETFKRGKFKNVSCFDINSLYPRAMEEDVPDPNQSKIVDKSSEYIINKYEGVTQVRIHIPNMKIPPLPYRHDGTQGSEASCVSGNSKNSPKKLIFPTGIIKGYWTHIELRNAMKHGCKILECYDGIFYTKKINLFKGFVNHHYNERNILKAEKNPLEVMEKNVMNNLYGKFAFNYKACSQIIPAERFDHKKHALEGMRPIPLKGGKFFIIESEAPPPVYSFPIWSAYITANARLIMYDYLSDERLTDKIIYTDTDSIFIENQNGEIQSSDELGKMKMEDGYPVKDAIFIRPKMYYTHKLKCKGLRVPKKRADMNDVFEKILNHEILYQQRFTKLRTALRSSDHHKYGVLKPNYIIQIEKSFNLEDSKRLWKHKFNPLSSEDSEPLKFYDLEPQEKNKMSLRELVVMS